MIHTHNPISIQHSHMLNGNAQDPNGIEVECGRDPLVLEKNEQQQT